MRPTKRNWYLGVSILLLISAMIMLVVRQSPVHWLNLAVSVCLVIVFRSVNSPPADSSRTVSQERADLGSSTSGAPPIP